MLFEKYQENEPENHQFLWFAVLSLVFLPLILYLAFAQFSPGLRNDARLHHTIWIDEARLRRADELCASLPRPEKLDFVSRFEHPSFAQSDDPSMVIYRYESIRGAEEIMPAFILWFEEKGWRQVPNTSTFEKGGRKVYISVNSERFHSFPNQYNIYCSATD